MRLLAVAALVFLVEVSGIRAQPCQSEGLVTPDRTYKLLRDQEDWSFLRDPTLPQDFWDPIKYIHLRNHRDDWYLSIGGETRQDWERIGNDNWGQDPFQNAFFLQRYMVHADLHYGKHYRSFTQLNRDVSSRWSQTHR